MKRSNFIPKIQHKSQHFTNNFHKETYSSLNQLLLNYTLSHSFNELILK